MSHHRHLVVPLALVVAAASSARAQQPDLIVASIDRSGLTGDSQTNRIQGTIRASISNIGDAAAAGPFTVVFFEDTNGNGAWDPGTDRPFGQATVPQLPASQKTTASAPIDVSVRFRGDLIFVVADSDDVVAESDETNNDFDTGRDCLVSPQPGALRPVLEWSWTQTNAEPAALNVMMTPSVIDLDLDGTPDVVFASTASRGGASVEVGFLRALNGSDGSERFTITDPTLRVNTASSVATGDIDGDGRPEIIACGSSGRDLIAFEDDGTFKWRSPALEAINWGAPSIADLDGDGSPEIVVGRQALDAAGNVLWTGTGSTGAAGIGPLSLVADIDLDGAPEIVAGNTVYDDLGTIQHQNTALPDGLTAVADFGDDPEPEIVVVGGSRVYLCEHDLTVRWGGVVIPGGGRGGPPTIADYDGDGEPEIGVAAASRYTVFETDGSIKWQMPTRDGSSNVTGSSVFDFEGDGAAEVVYRDELTLRIYSGVDGTVLWDTPMSSCTWFEYVLVADVDGDGNAEILAVANDNCGFGPERGVFVYGSANDDWVATRTIWNQHTYHITNVNDDGTIPRVERNNWQTPSGDPFNNYRQNVLTARSPNSSPDLTASFLRLPCTGSPNITVRIGNGGAILAPAGVPVSIYDGDPAAGGVLLATVATTATLQPGEFEDVTWVVPQGATLSGNPVFAAADDSGGLTSTQTECDETNNLHSLTPCATAASWTNYGQGWPGTSGAAPQFTLSADPVLGTAFDLEIENATARGTASCVLVGMQRGDRPTQFGGSILVDIVFELGLPLPNPGINRFSLQVPCNHAQCGTMLTMQVVALDPAASQGIAFSEGLELVIGR